MSWLEELGIHLLIVWLWLRINYRVSFRRSHAKRSITTTCIRSKVSIYNQTVGTKFRNICFWKANRRSLSPSILTDSKTSPIIILDVLISMFESLWSTAYWRCITFAGMTTVFNFIAATVMLNVSICSSVECCMLVISVNLNSFQSSRGINSLMSIFKCLELHIAWVALLLVREVVRNMIMFFLVFISDLAVVRLHSSFLYSWLCDWLFGLVVYLDASFI